MFYEWCLAFSNFSKAEFINFFFIFPLKIVKAVHAISNPELMQVCFPSSMDRRRHLSPSTAHAIKHVISAQDFGMNIKGSEAASVHIKTRNCRSHCLDFSTF